jgi:hypothetical protein
MQAFFSAEQIDKELVTTRKKVEKYFFKTRLKPENEVL